MQHILFLPHTDTSLIPAGHKCMHATFFPNKSNNEDWKTKKCQQCLLGDSDVFQQGIVGGWVLWCTLYKHTQKQNKPKPLGLKPTSSRNNLPCSWQNVEWHSVLSPGLPVASVAHRANTQLVSPSHLSVSVSESHSVVLLLFPSPDFLTLFFSPHRLCTAISHYIRLHNKLYSVLL